MAEIKWIKISTDMFNNPKVKFIRTLPQGNDIVLIWVLLLCRAGSCNAGGYIFLTENIPYTDEALANEFGMPLNTIKLALQTFDNLNMVTKDEHGFACILGWEEHQNTAKLEEIREYNRLAKQKSRAKQKLLTRGIVKDNVMDNQKDCQESQDTEEDIDIEKDNNLLYLEEIVNYYCSKAGKISLNLKPDEINTVEKLLKSNIPVDVIKKGIDQAFDEYKPKFQGEKISSFNYCNPVILGLWSNINAKRNRGAKNGSNCRNSEDELGKQGIGI